MINRSLVSNEIFDYLNGCEINQSFAYLNPRWTSNANVSLPMPPDQPSTSTIEYFVIDYPCNSQDLSNIISYTPHLSRLNVIQTLQISSNSGVTLLNCVSKVRQHDPVISILV